MASLAHSSDSTARNYKEKVRQFQEEYHFNDGDIEARVTSLFKKWNKAAEHSQRVTSR